ncbi:oxidoreductase [Streptomyces sp. MAR4 CNX-425]|uniref:oxidoreductase n=1 Tax=Streptomyces sp. MAR4 CNX-425 TaxID=3406343 RepID=UPI003B505B08
MTSATDPLAALTTLPGVEEAVSSVRRSVDGVYGHRVMRRRSTEVSAEAALRGARASAALSGADWALEEVRRRSDFSAPGEPRTVGGALRVSAEAGQLLSAWRQSPMRVLARLHVVASGGAGAADADAGAGSAAGSGAGAAEGGAGQDGAGDAVGRPRLAGESVVEPGVALPPPPDADETAARLDALGALVVAGSSAPALVMAAVVHGELLALRPFRTGNGLVARAAERIVLVSGGLDPKGVCPAEVGHAEQGREAYEAALTGYAAGTPEGVGGWIAHCGRAVGLGARESTAVCEALQRGAA